MYFAEKFSRYHAWLDLLLLANHKENVVVVRGISVTVKSGQVLACEDFLSTRWKWSRGKVRRFLRNLEHQSVHQVVQQKNNVSTVITICNWGHYQGNGTANGTANSTTDGQQTDIPKNVKNVKECKRSRFTPPSITDVKDYVVLKDYAVDAKAFVAYYESNGWMLGKSKMKKWESAVLTWHLRNEKDKPKARML